MSFIGSLDQGTSSTRFMIFDRTGNVVGKHQVEHRQILDRPGWVEHDASEIWANAQIVMTEAIKSAGIESSDLAAIGITNQRETVVMWDIRTGLPLAHAIVWQDTRTTDALGLLSTKQHEAIRELTGLTVSPYFSASKISWLIENNSSIRDCISRGDARVGTMDSWLLWNLSGGAECGVHLTDVTNASRTSLMNLRTLDWDAELLTTFSIPRAILPKITSSSEIYAKTPLHGPLAAEIPIAGMLGDQQAAMVGQARFQRGESKTTYGTGNFALLNTGSEIVRSKNGLLTTVLYKFGSESAVYALEGSVAVTGSAIQWLRDQLGIISTAEESETLAVTVENTGGVYFVPAFSGLFAPYWKSDARGVIVGLTRASTKAHIARAALEAICYQTRDIMEAMAADCGVPVEDVKEMRVDGGITSNKLCMQMQADVMGINITQPLVNETTALGAAYAAGLAIGYWVDINEVRELWKPSQMWSSHSTFEERELGYANWKDAVKKSFAS